MNNTTSLFDQSSSQTKTGILHNNNLEHDLSGLFVHKNNDLFEKHNSSETIKFLNDYTKSFNDYLKNGSSFQNIVQKITNNQVPFVHHGQNLKNSVDQIKADIKLSDITKKIASPGKIKTYSENLLKINNFSESDITHHSLSEIKQINAPLDLTVDVPGYSGSNDSYYGGNDSSYGMFDGSSGFSLPDAPPGFVGKSGRKFLASNYSNTFKNHDGDILAQRIMGRPLTAEEKEKYGAEMYDTVNGTLKKHPFAQNSRPAYLKKLGEFSYRVAHGEEMHGTLSHMANDVQLRTDASYHNDKVFMDNAMDALGRGDIDLLTIRNNLIDISAPVVAHKINDRIFGNTTEEDITSYKNEMKAGKTAQQILNERAHSERSTNNLITMVNGVQGRTDASVEYDGVYISSVQDAMANGTLTFVEARNNLINSPSLDGVIDKQIYRILGVSEANPAHKAAVRTELLSGKTMDQVGRELSLGWAGHAAVSENYIKVTGKEPFMQEQLDFYLGRLANGLSYTEMQRDLAGAWEGKKAVVDAGLKILGRTLTPGETKQYQNQLGKEGNSLKTVQWNMAHSDEVSMTITDHMVAERYYKELSGQQINDQVLQLQDDMSNGLITLDRVIKLVDLGARLTTIHANEAPGAYTPVPGHDPNSYLYTDGSGKKIWVTNRFSFQDIINDAKKYSYDTLSKNEPDVPLMDDGAAEAARVLKFEAARIARMNEALTQGGVYDAQRDDNYVVYQDSIDNANYNIGVWCAAAGVPPIEMNVSGKIYAAFKSANSYSSDLNKDVQMWKQGYDDYKSGYIKHQ